MKARTWYRFDAKAETPTVADLYVYDSIGKSFWDDDTVTAKKFIDDLNALGAEVATIRVHVNSPGGDVFDAVAIANALKQHKASIEVSIEGLAASAATIITCAGDVIRIGDNALFMVHNPWTFAMGEANDLRKTAEALDKVRDAIVATYRWVSELSAEEIVALMDAETWMDADEAVEKGFATEVVTGLKAAASIDPRFVAKLEKVPEKYQARLAEFTARPEAAPAPTPDPVSAPEPARPAAASAASVLAICTEHGVLAIAASLIEAGAPIEMVRERAVRAKEIHSLCAAAKVPELADGYIKVGAELDVVKNHLTTITAKLDKLEIDDSLAPGGHRPATVSVQDIYNARNQKPTKGA